MPGQQRVGRHRILGDSANAPRSASACRAGSAGHAVEHRAQQLVQPGERQVLLRFPARPPPAPASQKTWPARAASASRAVLPRPGSPRSSNTRPSAGGEVTRSLNRDSSSARPTKLASCAVIPKRYAKSRPADPASCSHVADTAPPPRGAWLRHAVRHGRPRKHRRHPDPLRGPRHRRARGPGPRLPGRRSLLGEAGNGSARRRIPRHHLRPAWRRRLQPPPPATTTTRSPPT